MNSRGVDTFVPDDVPVDLTELALRAEFHEGVEGSCEVLEDEAVSAQRLVVTRLSDAYVHGMMPVVSVEEGKKTTQEKRFNLTNLITWNEGEPTVLLDGLRAGRVRARLSARMGMGKSTRLPFLMANQLDCRVLHIALSGHVLQQASNYVKMTGLGVYRTNWSEKKKSSVTCMTYADFNGHMMCTERSALFRSFDIIFMDEGFVETVDVMVAKRFLAVYALPDTSIIVASATVSTDKDQESGASNLGRYSVVDKDTTVDQIAGDPRLIDNWIVDRTAIFCPTNEAIQLLTRVCEKEGLDVMSLDDASTSDDEEAVSQWLYGDGATVRVVVLHVKYGIGYNFPLSYGLIFPYESKLEFRNDAVISSLVPMTDEMVAQLMSRTGRGIVSGSGGIIFSRQRAATQVLSDSERITAFVKLSAGNIVPGRTDYWSSAYKIFPNGLVAPVAAQLLKICIHPCIAAKFLAPDGLFAHRFSRALNVFAQPDHYLHPSSHELPGGFDKWPNQVMIGTQDRQVKVPMCADGELKVVLQAISAMSNGDLDIERWRPPINFHMHDGYDSDDGTPKPTTSSRLRRIVDRPLPAPPVHVRGELPWSYTRSEVATIRNGGILDHQRMMEALSQWNGGLIEYKIPSPSLDLVKDEITEISSKAGVVKSPGGTKICEIPMNICAKLNDGRILSPNEFVELIQIIQEETLSFAMSRVFDMFSYPWDSFLNSLNQHNVVQAVRKNGIGTTTYEIVDYLRARLSTEISSVVASSNVFKRTYKSVFKRQPNFDDIIKQVRSGTFDSFAQTREFIDRVKELKSLIDTVLISAESGGMYLPTIITNTQRMLPVRGQNQLGYVGDDLKAMPKEWSSALSMRSGHTRSSSKSSLLNR